VAEDLGDHGRFGDERQDDQGGRFVPVRSDAVDLPGLMVADSL
jgi:hypothetical protein